MATLAPRKPRFDSPQQAAYLALWRTYDRLRAFEDALFARFDLTAQQYNALRLLRAEHPGTLRTLELARRLISRGPDITRLLDRLEKAGWIARDRPDGNRRVVDVGITSRGLALLEKIAEPLRLCHERQLGHLSAKQLREMSELLRAARAPHEDENSIWT